MKTLLIIVLLVLCILGYSQDTNHSFIYNDETYLVSTPALDTAEFGCISINNWDIQRENGSWIQYYNNSSKTPAKTYKIENKQLNGNCTTYYPSGQINETSNYLNGKKNGLHLSYYANGQLKDSCNYKLSISQTRKDLIWEIKNGIVKSWFENGNLRTLQKFNRHGIKIETSYEYYEDGQIKSLTNFEIKNRKSRYPTKDNKNGWQKWFYPNGQLRTSLHFSMDKIDHNYVREYYPNGQLKAEGLIDIHYIFSSAIIIKKGLWKHYYNNGDLFSKGEYTPTFYTTCCAGGPCTIEYSFKSGLWVYMHDKVNILGTGVYFNYQDHINTTCFGGDIKTYSKTTPNWLIKSSNGKLESEKYLNDLIIKIENSRGDFYKANELSIK